MCPDCVETRPGHTVCKGACYRIGIAAARELYERKTAAAKAPADDWLAIGDSHVSS